MKAPTKPKKKSSKKVAGAPEVTPRIARRERRRERSREEIVEAARRVILENGIAGTTLEAVARGVGLTKAALYYYYPSKDALFFELMYGAIEAEAQAINAAVLESKDGSEALGAIIGASVRTFGPRMDDFRLAFLLSQLSPDGARFTPEQFAKIRPLNNLALAAATKRLTEDWTKKRGRARVEPRLLAFLAHLAALGLLTMKGLVESVGDPLVYSDEQLIEGFASVFAAASQP